MGNRKYKTLRNIVLAGVMSAVGSGCVVTPGAMTYGAHLTNPGNAHIANAHGFAVLGDQGYRLAKAKENNYGRGNGGGGDKLYSLIDPTGDASLDVKINNCEKLYYLHKNRNMLEKAAYFRKNWEELARKKNELKRKELKK